MRGRARLMLTNELGEIVDERRVRNAVMRDGALLVARVFSGQGPGVTHMGVGTSDAPETDAYDTAALANDPTAPLAGVTETELLPAGFTIEPDPVGRVVRVKLRATLPLAAAVGTVREAGLLSRSPGASVLYNRVTFPPMTKGNDHELTIFWEVTFPYGDLHPVG
jgi:hypothetical protein